MTPPSPWKLIFVYDLAPWLSGVTDIAESKLSGVIDTAESKLSSVIDTAESAKTPLSQFLNFQRLWFPLKRQSNQIQARAKTAQHLWGKSLKNWACRKKCFWLRGVIDNSESTLNLNISANSKFCENTVGWTSGLEKIFDEKTRGQKFRETVPLITATIGEDDSSKCTAESWSAAMYSTWIEAEDLEICGLLSQ